MGVTKVQTRQKKISKIERNLQTLTPRIFKGTESKKRTWDCICSERERERFWFYYFPLFCVCVLKMDIA